MCDVSVHDAFDTEMSGGGENMLDDVGALLVLPASVGRQQVMDGMAITYLRQEVVPRAETHWEKRLTVFCP